MLAKQIVDHVYAIPLGIANVFLVNAGELTLNRHWSPWLHKKDLAGNAGIGLPAT